MAYATIDSGNKAFVNLCIMKIMVLKVNVMDDKITRYTIGKEFSGSRIQLSVLALIQIEKYIRNVAFALLAQPLSSSYLRRVPNDIIDREKCRKVRGFEASLVMAKSWKQVGLNL